MALLEGFVHHTPWKGGGQVAAFTCDYLVVLLLFFFPSPALPKTRHASLFRGFICHCPTSQCSVFIVIQSKWSLYHLCLSEHCQPCPSLFPAASEIENPVPNIPNEYCIQRQEPCVTLCSHFITRCLCWTLYSIVTHSEDHPSFLTTMTDLCVKLISS